MKFSGTQPRFTGVAAHLHFDFPYLDHVRVVEISTRSNTSSSAVVSYGPDPKNQPFIGMMLDYETVDS